MSMSMIGEYIEESGIWFGGYIVWFYIQVRINQLCVDKMKVVMCILVDKSIKQLETDGHILSTVTTDVLVLKHQAISIHSADKIFIVLEQLHTGILQL